VIGGYVFHGDSSALRGLYFFGDFCTGNVWTLNPNTGLIVDRTTQLGAAGGADLNLTAFGEDGFGRLLLVKRTAGTVHRISSATPPPPGCGIGPELAGLLIALGALRRRRRRLAG
jgi:MYXO-CTERM domain-containing protein